MDEPGGAYRAADPLDARAHALLCANCGAPIHSDGVAREVTCTYCGVANVVDERDDRPIFETSPHPVREERLRLAHLRHQVGRVSADPPTIAELLDGDHLASWREQEAMAMWQTLRRESRDTPDPEVADRLVRLSRLLAHHHRDAGDEERARALLESALDVVTFPRHRQVLRGSLSRMAAETGETADAEAWIQPCDPAAEDLDSDSAYRMAIAVLGIVTNDANRALGVLGESRDDIPFDAEFAFESQALRASALEMRGDVDQATLVVSALGTRNLDDFTTKHPTLARCPYARFNAPALEAVANRVVVNEGQLQGCAPARWPALITAVATLVIGTGLVVLLVFNQRDARPGDNGAMVGAIIIGIVCSIIFVGAVLAFVMAVTTVRRARKQLEPRATGTAEVVRTEPLPAGGFRNHLRVHLELAKEYDALLDAPHAHEGTIDVVVDLDKPWKVEVR